MSTSGQEAIELAASAGLHLDPWQQDVLRWALGERPDGKWSAFSVALLVPRQNGKGSVLEALELACLFLFGDELILHSAHEFKTAAEAFLRIRILIEGSDELSRLVMRVRTAAGAEAIELRTGQRLRFVARSSGSGRGFTGDKIVLDEAYNLNDKALAALLPTMATRPNPQLWYTSSAPLEGPESAVLRGIAKRGRSGDAGSLAYIEYGADPALALDDREAWHQANPGLGVRITEEFVELERGEFPSDTDFARERLGIWIDVEDASLVIPSEDWRACQTDQGMRDDSGVAFALDVSPDRTHASIATCGESALGGRHVEVVKNAKGTSWLVADVKALQEKWGGKVAIAEKSPAWSLKQELEDAGVELATVDTAEHAQACGMLYDGITDTQSIHHLGQAELDNALRGAERRFSGDSWLWSRKSSSVDISPLVAVTLALWAHSQSVEAAPGYLSMEELLDA